jgi:hypothetical protein
MVKERIELDIYRLGTTVWAYDSLSSGHGPKKGTVKEIKWKMSKEGVRLKYRISNNPNPYFYDSDKVFANKEFAEAAAKDYFKKHKKEIERTLWQMQADYFGG